MQEPVRPNLLNVLHRGLRAGGNKTYLHRIIYIGDYKSEKDPEDRRFYQMMFESNIKLINEDYCEEVLSGFGIFYTSYFINIIEGPENTINKHLQTLLKAIEESPEVPNIARSKVLLVSHHINKRYFFNWSGRPAKPPVLLEKIEFSKDQADNRRHVDTCLMKLYRLSEFLRNQPVGLFRATIDNISEVCQQYLPEFVLLDFLLNSPALEDLHKYVGTYNTIQPIKHYHDTVWPAPEDFVPYDIIGEDKTKKLIYTPLEEKDDVKKAEEEGEGDATSLDEGNDGNEKVQENT